MAIHLCFVYAEKQQHIEITSEQAELFTPLSIWKPAIIKDEILQLPEGWTVHSEITPGISQIDLSLEANYTLICDAQHARLMIRYSGPEHIQAHSVLMTARFSVGRAHTNELCCRDSFLSSYHGVFFRNQDGSLWYEDTSANGTFLNGQLIRGEKKRLHRSDQLDFLPLMNVVVDGGILHIRYPKEHAQIALQPLPTAQSHRCAMLFNQQTGQLHHIQLDPQINKLAAFRSFAAAQLPHNDKHYLLSACMLRDAETQTLITSDQALCQFLESVCPIFVML